MKKKRRRKIKSLYQKRKELEMIRRILIFPMTNVEATTIKPIIKTLKIN